MNRLHAGRNTAAALLIMLLIAPIGGCDTVNEQQNFDDEASRPPSGITRTEEGGEVVDEDPNDWRTAPLFRGIVRIEPAYPNPITSTQQWVTLPFWITDSNAISGHLTLRTFNNKGNFIPLDREDLSGFGSYQFDFHPSEISAAGSVSSVEGLHRLFVFNAQGELVTYGDLRISLEERGNGSE